MAVVHKARLCIEASLVVTKWTESPWPQGKEKQEKGREGRRKRIAKASSQFRTALYLYLPKIANEFVRSKLGQSRAKRTRSSSG